VAIIFRRQVPIAGYIVDFCCIVAGLGIEADGGQHMDEQQIEYDTMRSQVLLENGIRIIRFSDYDILKYPDAVQATIYRELTSGPLPNPPAGVPGEGMGRQRLKSPTPSLHPRYQVHSTRAV
jgi:very-short-patch-repair endonuclease